MITSDELAPIGFLGKPHGVNGEINLITDIDVDIDELSCVIMDIDGINVPFFFKSIRQRGSESYLVMIDGIDSDAAVSAFVNKKVYALKSEIEIEADSDDDADGFYAEDLVGYRAVATEAGLDGEIIGVDDSTDNVLFIVEMKSGKQVLIPVSDEFITEIDVDHHIIHMTLPDGLLEL